MKQSPRLGAIDMGSDLELLGIIAQPLLIDPPAQQTLFEIV